MSSCPADARARSSFRSSRRRRFCCRGKRSHPSALVGVLVRLLTRFFLIAAGNARWGLEQRREVDALEFTCAGEQVVVGARGPSISEVEGEPLGGQIFRG